MPEIPHNNQTNELVEFIASNEALQDPATRRDFFGRLGEDEFIDLVQQTAAIIHQSDSTLQHFDGKTARLMSHEVPSHEDKETLLRETWQTASEFLQDTQLPDDEALEYAALTIAGGILYTHPFSDGNGRVSRVLSYMISQGEADPKVITSIGISGGEAWKSDPIGLRIPDAMERAYTSEAQPKTIDWGWAGFEGTKTGNEPYDSIVVNKYRDFIARELLENGDEKLIDYAKKATTKKEDGTTQLSGEEFIAALIADHESGIGYARQMREIIKNESARYVRRYLAALRSDEMHPLHRVTASIAKAEVTPDMDAKTHYQVTTAKQQLAKHAVKGQVTVRGQYAINHRIGSGYYARKGEPGSNNKAA